MRGGHPVPEGFATARTLLSRVAGRPNSGVSSIERGSSSNESWDRWFRGTQQDDAYETQDLRPPPAAPSVSSNAECGIFACRQTLRTLREEASSNSDVPSVPLEEMDNTTNMLYKPNNTSSDDDLVDNTKLGNFCGCFKSTDECVLSAEDTTSRTWKACTRIVGNIGAAFIGVTAHVYDTVMEESLLWCLCCIWSTCA